MMNRTKLQSISKELLDEFKKEASIIMQAPRLIFTITHHSTISYVLLNPENYALQTIVI
jgi:hypothetical protein